MLYIFYTFYYSLTFSCHLKFTHLFFIIDEHYNLISHLVNEICLKGLTITNKTTKTFSFKTVIIRPQHRKKIIYKK